MISAWSVSSYGHHLAIHHTWARLRGDEDLCTTFPREQITANEFSFRKSPGCQYPQKNLSFLPYPESDKWGSSRALAVLHTPRGYKMKPLRNSSWYQKRKPSHISSWQRNPQFLVIYLAKKLHWCYGAYQSPRRRGKSNPCVLLPSFGAPGRACQCNSYHFSCLLSHVHVRFLQLSSPICQSSPSFFVINQL